MRRLPKYLKLLMLTLFLLIKVDLYALIPFPSNAVPLLVTKTIDDGLVGSLSYTIKESNKYEGKYNDKGIYYDVYILFNADGLCEVDEQLPSIGLSTGKLVIDKYSNYDPIAGAVAKTCEQGVKYVGPSSNSNIQSFFSFGSKYNCSAINICNITMVGLKKATVNVAYSPIAIFQIGSAYSVKALRIQGCLFTDNNTSVSVFKGYNDETVIYDNVFTQTWPNNYVSKVERAIRYINNVSNDIRAESKFLMQKNTFNGTIVSIEAASVFDFSKIDILDNTFNFKADYSYQTQEGLHIKGVCNKQYGGYYNILNNDFNFNESTVSPAICLEHPSQYFKISGNNFNNIKDGNGIFTVKVDEYTVFNLINPNNLGYVEKNVNNYNFENGKYGGYVVITECGHIKTGKYNKVNIVGVNCKVVNYLDSPADVLVRHNLSSCHYSYAIQRDFDINPLSLNKVIKTSSNILEVNYSKYAVVEDYIVDFYQLNSYGSLVAYLGNTASYNLNQAGPTVSFDLQLPEGVTVNTDDYIAATYTSLGDKYGSTSFGTSEVIRQIVSAPCPTGVILDMVESTTKAKTVNCNAVIEEGKMATGYTYLWDFGDGTTSTLANPSHTYSNYGTYNIKLNMTNAAAGCVLSETTSQTIENHCPTSLVLDLIVDENSKKNIICSYKLEGGTIISGYTYLWDFGDGTTSTLASPSHLYNAYGTYNVKLKMTNTAGGCDLNTSKEFIIYDLCDGASIDFVPSLECKRYNDILCRVILPDGYNRSDYDYEWTFTRGLALSNDAEVVRGFGPIDYDVNLKITSKIDGCVRNIKDLIDRTSIDNFQITTTPESPIEQCENVVFNLPVISYALSSYNKSARFDFGDGYEKGFNYRRDNNISYRYNSSGTYTAELIMPNFGCILKKEVEILPKLRSVCETGYDFEPGKKYVLTAWVKQDVPLGYISYSSTIDITIEAAGLPDVVFKARPSGKIIDGWQRIEQVITIPDVIDNFSLTLNSGSDFSAYFDDIRIHPFEASMKSYVYDPSTQKLAAQLDENGYATFYEYDEQGKLIRVKKETERGIQTIQESFNNTKKTDVPVAQ